MTYTEITSLALIIVVLVDIFVFKTSMLTTRGFWASYAIVLPFQLLTNWWLTSVSYTHLTLPTKRIV